MEFGIGAGNFAGRPTRNLALAKYLASSHGIIEPPAVGNPLTWGLPCVAGGPEGPVGNLGSAAARSSPISRAKSKVTSAPMRR